MTAWLNGHVRWLLTPPGILLLPLPRRDRPQRRRAWKTFSARLASNAPSPSTQVRGRSAPSTRSWASPLSRSRPSRHASARPKTRLPRLSPGLATPTLQLLLPHRHHRPSGADGGWRTLPKSPPTALPRRTSAAGGQVLLLLRRRPTRPQSQHPQRRCNFIILAVQRSTCTFMSSSVSVGLFRLGFFDWFEELHGVPAVNGPWWYDRLCRRKGLTRQGRTR